MIDCRTERHPLELLTEEFVARYRQGEHPSITEYTLRHPDLAEEIRALFPTVVLMEGLKRDWLPKAADEVPAPGRVPERLGDFRIVREVGRGGMGIVYEAEQESLERRVAVKVLTAHALLDPGQQPRFHREAQAMARLHHTNIVQVFGVGEDDGLFYYVMQFIDGQGLDTVIQDPACAATGQPGAAGVDLTPVRVARLGLQVAEALAYAHDQGILHRDIKPSNLLLDSRGTVWITDFGLAKLVAQDDGTQPSELAGTLRYMAPERFRGQSDARSDVYGLGLTLYELLTRQPAFGEADRSRLVRQVTQGKPPAPRQVNPAIPRDLETIVLRALARDPERRYRSAGELAEDLRRFLEDRPVRARRAGPGEHCWRWCRRNPAIASLTAAAASLLVLVAVSIVAGYVHARVALNREASLHAEAEEQRKAVTGQRERAEANLALALRAFEEIFIQASRRTGAPVLDRGSDENEPACPPVVTPEVAALLQNLLQFYDQFGERNQFDARLEREIAKAYRRMGDIYQRLGQLEKAETAYRQALALHEQRPGRSSLKAAIHNELGVVLQQTGRYAEAEQAHRQALELLRTQGSESVRSRYEEAHTHTLLGSVLWKISRAGEVEEHQRSALELLAHLLEEDAHNPEYRLAQARSYRSLSSALAMKGRHQDALDASRKAIALLNTLTKDFPDVPDYRYELGEVLIRSAPSGPGPWQHSGAERQLRSLVDLAKDLAASYPAVPQYQALQARAVQRLGSFLQMSGRSNEAERFHVDAVTLNRALVKQFPAVPFYQMNQAEACRSWGGALLRRGRLDEARALLKEAIAAQETVASVPPENRFGRSLLARDYQTLSETLRRLGDEAEANAASQRAEMLKKKR